MEDRWGATLAADDPTTLDAWHRGWDQFCHFTEDPFPTMLAATATDPAFALGAVFTAAYRILGGARHDAAEVTAEVATVRDRAEAARERDHLAALETLIHGDFTEAATRWMAVAADHHDFAATRLAHDVCLHVAEPDVRVRAAAEAVERWPEGSPGWGFIAGQYSFALEEVGRYDEAILAGERALDHDPQDLWALHALAHVHESRDDQAPALELLQGRVETWRHQEQLAVHVWWHLALRLIEAGRYDEVLELNDRLAPDASTPFRMSDLISMLWRLELRGVDVGDRWDRLADAWAIRPERHTCGFLDLHGAMIYTRRPDHPEADRFFDGIDQPVTVEGSQNDHTMREVVPSLVAAIRTCDVDPAGAMRLLDQVADRTHLIGGSVAQRDVITKTRSRLEVDAP
ncbi:MAG: hypothetical protein AAF547_15980 [Actinomycetota bacterium]